ncbi:aldo/keto reductase [Gilvimarinus polysaccharolyticus]|uniref:aldo/keto reductase n=1 Tax=Gilvimarinus polysaccharolyticus TaxID=863921 RepID=UPI001E440C49|nr:aldo/keto reductase [Gilvimarinus polysaccharolyticus]
MNASRSKTPIKPIGGHIQLPALGFGAAPLGNLYRAVSDKQADETLAAAHSAGFNYFDTAPHYGFGLSESRLAAALQTRPELVVSSKVGRLLVPINSAERAPIRQGFANTPDLKPVFDYRYEAVMDSFAQSCQRLGRERIDIVYAHDLGVLTHGSEDAFYWQQFTQGGYRALQELKAAGRIGAIGLGVNEVAVCQRALNELQIDVLLLAGRYTLLEQTAAPLLEQCVTAGVSVVVGGAFNSGILARGVMGSAPHYYDYQPAADNIIRRVRALEIVCAEFDVPLSAAALQFPAAHPQVVSVVAGLACAAEVEQAKRWFEHPIPTAFWHSLRERGLMAPGVPVPA